MAKILVIEDDENFRELLCRMLRSGGHETTEADDGARGVTKLAHDRPDLVITDLVMPGQEGIETIQQIVDIDATVPIIAISGMWSIGDFAPLDDARAMGAAVALPKPIERKVLLAEVAKLLATANPSA
jgi:CheY-like chemotaxis protein